MSERKYRQRGYMDDERSESRSRGSGPRPRREGPRGRGLGAPTATVFRCARCGGEQSLAAAVPFDATCGGCGSDLHTCTNCRHFDSSAPNQCRETIPAPVPAKARRNRCELFAPRTTREFGAESARADDPEDPRAAFDALFKL